MVNFTILLLLYLITESAGILDGDIDIISKLKSKSMQDSGSNFSKKLESLKEKRLKSRILNNLRRDGNYNQLTGFKHFCRTLLSKSAPKICKQLCYKRNCYNFCIQIRKICTI